VRDRDKSEDLKLEDAIIIAKYYIYYGVKGIEMTGGGEPTLWPHFEEFIEKISKEPIKIGLITNGRTLHKYSQEFLRHFTWIRVSANGIDNGWMPTFEIPPEVVFSFSYVWHKETHNLAIIEALRTLLRQYPNAKALKIQSDLLEEDYQEDQGSIYDLLKDVKQSLNDSRIFIGSKGVETIPAKCYIGWLKPHLSANGKIYRCSTSALKERCFIPEFVIGDIDHLPQFIPDAETFKTLQHCNRCFYTAQNELMQKIQNPIEHSEFL
jgi:MoaA/NifB/PqqE/SkfB family radical SAM enzyme